MAKKKPARPAAKKAKPSKPPQATGGGGAMMDGGASSNMDSGEENFSALNDDSPVDEGLRWRGKLRFMRVPHDEQGNPIEVKEGEEEIFEYSLDDREQPIYPLGKWFLQAMLFDKDDQEAALKDIKSAMADIGPHLAVLSTLQPCAEIWQSLIQTGVQALDYAIRTHPDEKERKRATEAMRDISSMFVKKFKKDSLQPWLAKRVTDNEALWQENRRITKRHNGDLMSWLMLKLAYFDQSLQNFLRSVGELQNVGRPREVVEAWTDRTLTDLYSDEPGMLQSMRLAVKQLCYAEFRSKNTPEKTELLPPSVACLFWRMSPVSYLEVVWPYIIAEWDLWPKEEKSKLPKGIGGDASISKKPRLSPGVFRARCLEIIETLLKEYRHWGIPQHGESIKRTLERHSTWGK